MTLSGFNQEGGTVTGNIQNLTIESKQNTSTTKGSTVGGSLSIAPNGMPSGSINYSQTNGERKYVDNATTFLIGNGSNLKIGKVENTAAAIGATGNGKLSIDEYVGHNLENVDKSKTVGGSVGISTSGINSIGINYNDRKQEGITKNTVIGNVEIGKSSGDEINKDLASMTEVTKDRKFETNVNIESQTIKYALNPEAFKEDIQKAKNEINDIYHAVDSTVNPQGKESRNILQQLGEVRQAKTILNVVGSRLEIAENQEDIAKAFEGVSEDLGYKVKVIYTNPSNSPQLIGIDKDGSTYIKDGTAYVDKTTGVNYILINSESPANRTKAGVIGTIAEEQSHIIGKLEGRQKTVPDGSEKGLESLGKPTNDYFKNQYSKNDKAIRLKSDGKDYSNVDFGEHVGDGRGFAEFKETLKYGASDRNIVNHLQVTDGGKIFDEQENKIEKILVDEKNNISSEKVHEELRKMATIGGTGHNYSSYEGIYAIDDPNLRKKFIDKDNNLNLALFDPKGWNEIKKSESYKNAVNNLKQKAIKYYEENKLKSKEEIEKKRSVSETVKFAGLFDTDKSEIEYALGNSTIVGSIVMRRGKPYLKYNLSDKFEDITGLNKGPLEIEWGQPYDMIGPTKLVPLYDKK